MLANGDAYSYADVAAITALTQADGVMAARGVLENPAMFLPPAAPEEEEAEEARAEVGTGSVPNKRVPPPRRCLHKFLAWSVRCPIPFPLVLHHIHDMTLRMPGTTKRVKKALMECGDLIELLEFVERQWPLPE